MDIATLAISIATFLSPFLPYLVKGSEQAAEEVGKQLGADAWELAKKIWSKLHPLVETKPRVKEAIEDVATNSNDADAQAVLRIQLKKLLVDNPTLVSGFDTLFSEARSRGLVVNATGDRSVGIGGNVNGSTIITGDHNITG